MTRYRLRRPCLNCRVPTTHAHLCVDCIRASVVSAIAGGVALELVRLLFGWLVR